MNLDLLAMGNQPMRRIVRGQANSDSVPHDNTNFEAFHFSAESRRHGHTVIQ
jgi:hypothetical protein